MRKSLSAVLVLVLLLTGVLSGTVFAKTSEQRTVTGEEPTKAGSLFAGWFEDAEMTTPITAPAANSQAYAKFVDEAVLSVKYQITADANETMDTVNMRVVTATDSLNYANVGFKLEYGTHTGADAVVKTSKKVSKTLIGYNGTAALQYTPAEAFGTADAEYFSAFNFTVPAALFDTPISVTAFWDTLDGTRVYGTPREIKISDAENYNNVLIGTAAELTAFAAESQTKNFEGWKIKLTADIDLNPGFTATAAGFSNGNGGTPVQWTPIGSTSKYFKGTFDGQGHTISGMYLNSGAGNTGTLYLGLFAATSGVSTVKNFRLENSYLYTRGQRNGSIAGDGCGNFENIYSNAIIVTEGGNATAIGGITGFFDGSMDVKYSNLQFDGTVTGSGYYVGGILGHAANGANTTLTIENCKNSGVVSSSDVGVGSIVGIVDTANASAAVAITGCWNTASVSATNGIQGFFVGRIRGEGNPTVNISDSRNSFATALNPVGTQNTGTVNVKRVLGVRSNDVKIWPDSGEATSVAPSALTSLAGIDTLTPYGFDFNTAWAAQYGSQPIPAAFATIALDKSWYTGGDTYILNDAGDMYAFALLSQSDNFEGKTIKLGADIDLNPGSVASESGMSGSPLQWTSISSTSKYFKGTFDGDGHTISGLYQNSTTHTGNLYLGLFAATSGSSMVKNFRLENSYIYTKGGRNGSIAGNGDGNFKDIYSNAIIVTEGGNAASIGGMVGYFDGSTNVTYSNLQFDGILKGSAYWAGGILGRATNSAGNTLTIQNCKMSGSVTTSDSVVGGILGLIDTTASSVTINISGCWTSGSVYAPSSRGTVIGTTRNGAPVINVKDTLCSYVTEINPTGSENITVNYRCVLYVRADYAKVYNASGVKSDSIAPDALKGAVAESTLSEYGFDFDTSWSIREGDYPVPRFFQ